MRFVGPRAFLLLTILPGLASVCGRAAIGNDKSEIAVVTRVSGIASLQIEDQNIVQVYPLAGEEDLQSWLGNTEGQTAVNIVSAADIERFLTKRDFVRNFLLCFVPPGSEVKLQRIGTDATPGRVVARVSFQIDDTHWADLASLMLIEGFAVPTPERWMGSREEIRHSARNDLDVGCFLDSIALGKGLWTKSRRITSGYEPLSLDLNAKCAVPFPLMPCGCHSESSTRLPHVGPYVGITIVVADARDVVKVARARQQLERLLVRHLENVDGSRLDNVAFRTELGSKLVTLFESARVWSGSAPRIADVGIRFMSVLPDDYLRDELDVPKKDR